MKRREFIMLVGGAGFLGSRAASALAQSEPPKVYEVVKGNRLVLTVSSQPGSLVSIALPAPGRPVSRPFLSASAHAPEEESSLREILERSRDFPDFIERLRSAGYTLRERTAAQPSR